MMQYGKWVGESPRKAHWQVALCVSAVGVVKRFYRVIRIENHDTTNLTLDCVNGCR